MFSAVDFLIQYRYELSSLYVNEHVKYSVFQA